MSERWIRDKRRKTTMVEVLKLNWVQEWEKNRARLVNIATLPAYVTRLYTLLLVIDLFMMVL